MFGNVLALIGYEEFEFYTFRGADVQQMKLLLVKIRDEHDFGQKRLSDHDIKRRNQKEIMFGCC